ncbi:MAG: hypothetical protein H6555_10685 [Lewinellaceae bacterium]|nr:hypothetical protein [Lewinellaceae bacterium]
MLKTDSSANMGVLKPIFIDGPMAGRIHGTTITLAWKTVRGNEPFIIELAEKWDGPAIKKYESATTSLALNSGEFTRVKRITGG